MVGHTPLSANAASTPGGDYKASNGKRRPNPNRGSGGRFQKAQKTSSSETFSQTKQSTTSSFTTSRQDSSNGKNEGKCTRCWQVTRHNFRSCTETKCACGKPLAPDQPICYNYENHPASAKFADSPPKMLMQILEAYKRGGPGSSAPSNTPSQSSTADGSGKSMTTRSRFRKGTKAMAASVAEELIRRGVTGENLDRVS